MFAYPSKYEIDHRTIKLIIGVIALTLGNITSLLSEGSISSISASYYQGDWPRNIFVGFLFAISGFMLAYNGYDRTEMLISKVAAFAALGVAMFPCGCDSHIEIIPHVHYICAAIMFSILACFCGIFYKRAKGKGHKEGLRRARIYLLCGIVIITAMTLMLVDFLTHDALTAIVPRLTFYCERAGLVAFGVSWLTASHVIPVISDSNERFSPFV